MFGSHLQVLNGERGQAYRSAPDLIVHPYLQHPHAKHCTACVLQVCRSETSDLQSAFMLRYSEDEGCVSARVQPTLCSTVYDYVTAACVIPHF